MKRVIYFLMFFLLVGVSSGATIYGEIYAWDTLEEIGAIVEIDSVPKQVMVVDEGEEYSFELSEGSYILTAVSTDGLYYTNETIEIEGEGDSVIHLILWYSDGFFDDLVENDTIDEDDFDFGEEEAGFDYVLLVLILIVFGVGVLFFYYLKRRKPSEEKLEKEVLESDEDMDKVLGIIKESKGRITQKEVRKKMMPLSEAKVSLLITELEDKGMVKRIKKGRGNVIILRK
tara:strand:- start:114 stop:803 length:690 start_codon:yes stop_codon:yes gene_type:complete